MLLLSIIKKNLKFILIFTFVIVVVVLVVSRLLSGGYNVSFSLLVSVKNVQQTTDYKYDGYYNIMAANEFGSTVAQWVASPEILNAAYQKSGLSQSFLYRLKAQKMAPQYVRVEFRTKETQQAQKISDALISSLQGKAALASETSGDVVFSVSGGQPVVSKNQANYFFNFLVSLVGGILVSIFIVLLKQEAQNDYRG